MFVPLNSTSIVDFFFVLPEICLLVSILHSLYKLAKETPVHDKSYQVFIKPYRLAKAIYKITTAYLQLALLILAGFLLKASMDSWLVKQEDGYDWVNLIALKNKLSLVL